MKSNKETCSVQAGVSAQTGAHPPPKRQGSRDLDKDAASALKEAQDFALAAAEATESQASCHAQH